MYLTVNNLSMGRSPGLVVMGGDSCPEGHGFKSLHHILNGYFSKVDPEFSLTAPNCNHFAPVSLTLFWMQLPKLKN